MRSKVAAINGNCLQGYNIEIIKLKEEYNYSQGIFLALSAMGDAVELKVASKNGMEFFGGEKQESSASIKRSV